MLDDKAVTKWHDTKALEDELSQMVLREGGQWNHDDDVGRAGEQGH